MYFTPNPILASSWGGCKPVEAMKIEGGAGPTQDAAVVFQNLQNKLRTHKFRPS